MILKHCAERRRDRHRELERYGIVGQPLHHSQQRDVCLGDRLKQPLLFNEVLVLRMADERKMRVENQSELAGHFESDRKAETDWTRWIGFSEDDVNLAPEAQLLWQSVGDNAFHLQRAAKVLEAIQTFFDYVKACRVTEANGAIVAKSSARNDRDVGFAQ